MRMWQNKKCAITGTDIYFSTKISGNGSASLDRIDSKAGYIIGNVQWVHKDINWMKADFGETEFIEWCKKVAINNP